MFAALGALIGYGGASMVVNEGCLPWNDKVDHFLARSCSQINTTLPRLMDPETRMDHAEPLPNHALRYSLTLINKARLADFDPREFFQTLRPKILAGYKTHPDLDWYRDHKVTLHYQ